MSSQTPKPDGPAEPEGAWQCGAGHMFRYEPPPASPPWCAKPDCHAGDFRWIIKDEVTADDWLPDETPTEAQARIMQEVQRKYINQIGQAFLAEMKLPTPKPASRGIVQQAHIYDRIVSRKTDGSDPLVEEPGP
jgi:hypothetical protein